MAAAIGVSLDSCGSSTIPLLQAWPVDGTSLGSAAALMGAGPAAKITNLGSLQIVLGFWYFLLHMSFIIIFSLFSGIGVNGVF